MHTSTLPDELLKKWKDWSKRDDAFTLFAPSDARQMLGEIDRLRAALQIILAAVESHNLYGLTASEQFQIFIGHDNLVRVNVDGACVLRVRLGPKCEIAYEDRLVEDELEDRRK